MDRKFLTDTAAFGLASALLRLRGLIVLPLFASLLGTVSYGLFTQLAVAIALLAPLFALRLETAVVRFVSGEDDQAEIGRIFYSGLAVITLAVTVVGMLLNLTSELGAELIFGDASTENLMTITSLVIAVSVLDSYFLSYLRATHRVKTQSAMILVESLIETAMIVGALFMDLGLSGAVGSMLVVRSTIVVALTVVVARECGWPEVRLETIAEMLRYSIPLVPNSLMYWVVNYADRSFIIRMLGLSAVGVYAASYSLGSSLSLLAMPIGIVLFPFVTRLWDNGEHQEVRRYFAQITRLYTAMTFPACITVAFLSQPLLRYLGSSEFETSSFLVFLIAIGAVLKGLFQINVYAFHLVHKTKYVSLALGAGSAVNALLNLVLIPFVGIGGAALATAFTFLLMAFMSTVYSVRLMRYRINTTAIAKTMLAGIVMTVFLLMFPATSVLGAGVLLALGLAIYGVVVVLLKAVTFDELAKLIAVLRDAQGSPVESNQSAAGWQNRS